MKLDWKRAGTAYMAVARIGDTEWSFLMVELTPPTWELSIGLDGKIVAVYTSKRRDDLALLAQARCNAAVRKDRKS